MCDPEESAWQTGKNRKKGVRLKVARGLYQSWYELEKEMCDQLIVCAQEEGIHLPDGKGLIKKLERVMQKYGFKDGNGWWILSREA